MAEEHLTIEEVLRELQIDEKELERLVDQGSLRKVDSDGGPRFHRDDVAAIKEDLEAMKTINVHKPPKKDPPP